MTSETSNALSIGHGASLGDTTDSLLHAPSSHAIASVVSTDEEEHERDTEDDSEDGEENVEDCTVGSTGNGVGKSAHGEDEDDGENEDEEEDDDDEEPTLKYERMSGPINDLLRKDSISAISVSNKLIAVGTHSGIVHVLDMTGKRIKSYKPHQASISDMEMDNTADFVATASIDGQVVIQSLSTQESYMFYMKRPIRTVALEPNFAKKSTRAFICGGMAGTLVLREKGWLGHKESVLHSGEGPIWNGVKIYDTQSHMRITYIDRGPDSPRADLFKCTLHWQDDTTLLITWADHIKVARLRPRSSLIA
ncbi:hypothetical protein M404DRAFT_36420 [Pisolithus tinctorius Marx 270]|uniref:Vps41 beta-propeller domain-containing protein n=1 Tax=Pisolithus tinctorius Marx 270 TaxID=870435 RepID=A0A0C3J5S9_PISTI|nr:hypothetical protein M404DRAFT_36420 [Pisolithus tinctorius Marx 270]